MNSRVVRDRASFVFWLLLAVSLLLHLWLLRGLQLLPSAMPMQNEQVRIASLQAQRSTFLPPAEVTPVAPPVEPVAVVTPVPPLPAVPEPKMLVEKDQPQSEPQKAVKKVNKAVPDKGPVTGQITPQIDSVATELPVEPAPEREALSQAKAVEPANVQPESLTVATADKPALKLPPASTSQATSTTVSATPRYDMNPLPDYPRVARQRGWEGTALFEVRVGSNGKVSAIELIRSSGYKSLDRSAHKTLRRWRFRPATALGLPVETVVQVPITFSLRD